MTTIRQKPANGSVASQPPERASDAALPMVVVQRDVAEKPPGIIERAMPVLRRLRFLPLIPLLLLTGGLIGLYFQPPGLRLLMQALHLQPGGGARDPIAVPAPPKPAPAAAGPRIVVALGKLVPEGEVRTVAPPFGAGDARIASIAVEEGARVEAGATLAVLDNEAQLQAAVDAAAAAVAAREAALEQTRASVRASREEAAASLGRAEAQLRNADAEFERAETLVKKGVAGEALLIQRRAARDEALREVERYRATLSRYAGGDIDQQPDVVVAVRNLAASRSDLARARQELEKAYVRAPIPGTVLTVHARPGEKPGSSGILTLGNLERMEVEIEVYQSYVKHIAVGDAVEVTAEALPDRLAGKVSRVGLEVGRQTLVDPSPAANTDARVVRVHAALDEASSKVARRFTNLQVLTRIVTRSGP